MTTASTDEALMALEEEIAHWDGATLAARLPELLRFGREHAGSSLLTKQSRLLETIVFTLTAFSDYNRARLDAVPAALVPEVIALLRDLEARSDLHRPDAERALRKYWLQRMRPVAG